MTDARGLDAAYALSQEAREHLVRISGGDARRALTSLEAAAGVALDDAPAGRSDESPIEITLAHAEQAVAQASVRYDKTGDQHYDVASAFIKSMRGSDVDAALHYLARQLQAGEDPRFIARRIVISASEDVGMGDPTALQTAVAAMHAVAQVGMPEARIILAQAVVHNTLAPKSNAAYAGINAAIADIRGVDVRPFPLTFAEAGMPVRPVSDTATATSMRTTRPTGWRASSTFPTTCTAGPTTTSRPTAASRRACRSAGPGSRSDSAGGEPRFARRAQGHHGQERGGVRGGATRRIHRCPFPGRRTSPDAFSTFRTAHMETAEIRRRWLAFFEKNGHTVVPSAPLIHDDPNLLFVNAGMVPFKPYFSGQETPPWERATSVQKCVRTGDIEEVGKTSRHGTFFQMNGNFSFGDYFKKDAIRFAWQSSTTSQDEGGHGLDPTAWATVYLDDDEASDLWAEAPRAPARPHRASRQAANKWYMGVPGPCGPCTEMYLRPRPGVRREGGPAVDEDRYLEFWNLVFMQDELSAGPRQGRLRHRRGAAEEEHRHRHGPGAHGRPAQGVDNLYEIDEVYPVLDKAAELTGKRYGPLRPRGEPVAPGRRAPARRRRPRPLHADAHRRRRHARQRGTWLRPAPHAATRRALDAAAGLRRPGPAAPAPHLDGADEAVRPRA